MLCVCSQYIGILVAVATCSVSEVYISLRKCGCVSKSTNLVHIFYNTLSYSSVTALGISDTGVLISP